MSSTLRRPPPTVNGMLMLSATRRTMSVTIWRRSDEAVISRNTNSSAPSSEYRSPHSTGSPASRRFTKLMPFTTRPSFTSRQGMMRLASMDQRLLDLNAAFVKRLADDHTVEPRMADLCEAANVCHRRDSAGGDYGQLRLFEHLARRIDV